jgi:hypothetical protein
VKVAPSGFPHSSVPPAGSRMQTVTDGPEPRQPVKLATQIANKNGQIFCGIATFPRSFCGFDFLHRILKGRQPPFQILFNAPLPHPLGQCHQTRDDLNKCKDSLKHDDGPEGLLFRAEFFEKLNHTLEGLFGLFAWDKEGNPNHTRQHRDDGRNNLRAMLHNQTDDFQNLIHKNPQKRCNRTASNLEGNAVGAIRGRAMSGCCNCALF